MRFGTVQPATDGRKAALQKYTIVERPLYTNAAAPGSARSSKHQPTVQARLFYSTIST